MLDSEAKSGHDVRRIARFDFEFVIKVIRVQYQEVLLARVVFERRDNSVAMQSTACRSQFEPPSITQLDRSESSARPKVALDTAVCN